MAVNIDINGITGTSPFNIFLCDINETPCYYITQVSSFPFSFQVPPPINTYTSFILKVVDVNNCVSLNPIVLPV